MDILSEFDKIADAAYKTRGSSKSAPVFVHRQQITDTARQMIALLGDDDQRAAGIRALAEALSCPL